MKKLLIVFVALVSMPSFSSSYKFNVVNNNKDSETFVSVGKEVIRHVSDTFGRPAEEIIDFDILDLRPLFLRFGTSPLKKITDKVSIELKDKHFDTTYVYFFITKDDILYKSKSVAIGLCHKTDIEKAESEIVVDKNFSPGSTKYLCISKNSNITIRFE